MLVILFLLLPYFFVLQVLLLAFFTLTTRKSTIIHTPFNYSDHPLTSTILSNVTHPLSNIPFSHSMSAHPLLVLRQPPFTTHIPMFHLPTALPAIPTLSLLNPSTFFILSFFNHLC